MEYFGPPTSRLWSLVMGPSGDKNGSSDPGMSFEIQGLEKLNYWQRLKEARINSYQRICVQIHDWYCSLPRT